MTQDAIVKKGDFIQLNYTAKIKEGNVIFDTTYPDVAKEAHLHLRHTPKPLTICAGEKHVLEGLDEHLIGKKFDKFTVEIPTEKAFGKKSAKLLQLVPKKVFTKEKIQPYVGLEVNIDNQVGVIRSASGGRIIVDFNHPLAGKDLIYDVEIVKAIEDKKEQITALFDILRMPYDAVAVKDNKAEVTVEYQMPPQFIEIFVKDIVRLTGIADVIFKTKEAPKADEEKK